MNTLVVPTVRPASLTAFLDAWSPWPWDRILVVEDGPEVTIKVLPNVLGGGRASVEVFSWAEIDALLPEPGIISRGDSAIRSFGFWKAWSEGAEVIFTLDDDCFPLSGLAVEGFVEAHLDNLYRTPRWDTSVPGLRVRGLPYRNLGVLTDVALSMGVWAGTPDVDAVQSLAAGPGLAAYQPGTSTRVMAGDQFFPMSGMNLAVRREIACLMYFAPMGEGQPYRRFDDIWCGLVVQTICRHLRYPIVCGAPVVDHQRASDPFVNLVKEAAGIGANERIWEGITRIRLSASTPLGCLREVGEQLGAAHDGDPYAERWGADLLRWSDLFEDGA